MSRMRNLVVLVLLAVSLFLVGGVLQAGPVQGEAWVITAPSPSAPDDAKGLTQDIGKVDTTVTLDMIIATFRGMTGGDKVVTKIQDAQAAATRGGKAVDRFGELRTLIASPPELWPPCHIG